ncbi:uncharacterized protein LOC126740306 isoform X2 [Anthonomus grandis grandis]|uniref:uncharacterized protein LOC126740306 isoform X2 n=1 Tax=Anthonomus grandis grandis TaxID=2921223 RepID=UPI002165A8BC|nr:uncharacterized protein LOC126740306 isoform X2 [Anthonomus grandis grandis]
MPSTITSLILLLGVLVQGMQMAETKNKVTYNFPEFPYKETKKNEAIYREVEIVCEKGCLGKSGLSKVTCVRQCVSPSCYKDLYQQDMLEEGEVDVRLNSFKGCFIQRYNKTRP